MNEGEQMSDDVEYVTWDFGDWPEVAPTEILPGLWMGGLAVDEYAGQPLGESHYSFDSPYDIVVTLFGDAQPAPWGVIELRYGFPRALPAGRQSIWPGDGVDAHAGWPLCA